MLAFLGEKEKKKNFEKRVEKRKRGKGLGQTLGKKKRGSLPGKEEKKKELFGE